MTLTTRWVGFGRSGIGGDRSCVVAGLCPAGTGRSPVTTQDRRAKLFCRGFFVDHDLQVRSHVLVQFDRDGELADRLQRLMQLDLTAVDVEALFLERFGNI